MPEGDRIIKQVQAKNVRHAHISSLARCCAESMYHRRPAFTVGWSELVVRSSLTFSVRITEQTVDTWCE